MNRALTLELLPDGNIAVAFPYDDGIVSRLRALKCRKWNRAAKRWEVHIEHLQELMQVFELESQSVDRRLYRAYQMHRIKHGRARIVAGHVYATLTGSNLPFEKIDRASSFFLPGYRYMTRYKKGQWDGRRHLFNEKTHQFPSGLVPRVSRLVRDSGTECDIVWAAEISEEKIPFTPSTPGQNGNGRSKKEPRSPVVTPAEAPPDMHLRDYQVRCIDTAIKAGRGVIEIATGGGKTVIAAEIIRRLERPTLFIVHTKDLLHQTISVLSRLLQVPVGQVGDGVVSLEKITVATVQSCARALDVKIDQTPDDDEVLECDRTDIDGDSETLINFIRTVPVVFFDECHHLPADTAYSLAMEMEGAAWRFGLSATPYRADRQDLLLEAALGPKIFSARATVLINQGYLVPPRIRFMPVPPLLVRSGQPQYQEIYTSYIIENKRRNKLIVEAATMIASEGKSVLILVSQVRHGDALQEMLHSVPLVQGEDSAEDRRRIFQDLQAKREKIVIATTLADEGLDVPSLDAVILASGGRSETRALQRVGRALRTFPGKASALVIDFMDDAPFLKDHATNRLEIFKSEAAFEVEMVQEKRPV